MKYVTEALLLFALLCLTSQVVESRPSRATEDAGSEERLKRHSGAQISGAVFNQGEHNFGTETNTYLTSQKNYGDKEGTQIVSQNTKDIKQQYTEKCVCNRILPSLSTSRNKRSPFDYSGSTQNYHHTFNGGTHNFGQKINYQKQVTAIDYNIQPQQILTSPESEKTVETVYTKEEQPTTVNYNVQTQQITTPHEFEKTVQTIQTKEEYPTIIDQNIQSNRVTISPESDTNEQRFYTKECHCEKVPNPEQGSIEDIKIRQKRGFHYEGSKQDYHGRSNHVQSEQGNPNWNNHQDYQGDHIQNSNEFLPQPNTLRPPTRQNALQAQQFVQANQNSLQAQQQQFVRANLNTLQAQQQQFVQVNPNYLPPLTQQLVQASQNYRQAQQQQVVQANQNYLPAQQQQFVQANQFSLN